jgi:hypothetical protein
VDDPHGSPRGLVTRRPPLSDTAIGAIGLWVVALMGLISPLVIDFGFPGRVLAGGLVGLGVLLTRRALRS